MDEKATELIDNVDQLVEFANQVGPLMTRGLLLLVIVLFSAQYLGKLLSRLLIRLGVSERRALLPRRGACAELSQDEGPILGAGGGLHRHPLGCLRADRARHHSRGHSPGCAADRGGVASHGRGARRRLRADAAKGADYSDPAVRRAISTSALSITMIVRGSEPGAPLTNRKRPSLAMS